jgi:hypothetical protein
MELKDLKKTWARLSSRKALDEDQLREMLRRRTSHLIDKIDRNVRIGFGVLFLFIVLFILDDFVFAPRLINDVATGIGIPQWLMFLSVFANVLIVVTFVYFVIQYYKVKKYCDISCNLKETLVKIIGTLRIYQRLFYLALFVFSITIVLQFISGLFMGTQVELHERNMLFSDVTVGKWLVLLVVGLVVLGITVGGIFLLLRWGFHRLYGNYISKLKQNLRELNEIDN